MRFLTKHKEKLLKLCFSDLHSAGAAYTWHLKPGRSESGQRHILQQPSKQQTPTTTFLSRTMIIAISAAKDRAEEEAFDGPGLKLKGGPGWAFDGQG